MVQRRAKDRHERRTKAALLLAAKPFAKGEAWVPKYKSSHKPILQGYVSGYNLKHEEKLGSLDVASGFKDRPSRTDTVLDRDRVFYCRTLLQHWLFGTEIVSQSPDGRLRVIFRLCVLRPPSHFLAVMF